MLTSSTQVQILNQPIKDGYIKILKPIAEQVTNKLLEDLHVLDIFKDKSSYNIYYHDDLETFSKVYTDDYKPKVSHNRCDVAIEPIYNPKELDMSLFNFNHDFTTGFNRLYIKDKQPIFMDPKYNIYIYELTIPTNIKLSFKIKVKSIEKADEINTKLYMSRSSGKIFQYEHLQYDYNIPFPILYTLFLLFKMRRTSKDFKFKSYLSLGSNKTIDIVIDQSQLLSSSSTKDNPFTQFSTNIHKTQVFAISKLNFELKKPESEDKKNQIVDRYTIEFECNIGFQRPISLQLHYPLVINNQMIPEEIIINTQPPGINETDTEYVHDNISINNSIYYGNNRQYIMTKYKTIVYPKDDNIIPVKRILGNEHIPIFQGIVQVDKSLDTLNYISLDLKKDIFPILKEHHDINALEDIIKTQKNRSKSKFSLVNILFYKNPENVIVDKLKYSIDDNLQIVINDNINHDATYRILITINTDWKYLDKDLVYKAFEHNTYTDSIIYKNLTPLVQNKYIDVKEIPKKDRENFLLDDPKYKTFVPGDVYPGTTLKGSGYNKPYQPFRIGNFIIYPRNI